MSTLTLSNPVTLGHTNEWSAFRVYILDLAKQYGDVDRLFKQRAKINYLQDARNERIAAFPHPTIIKSVKPTKGKKKEKLADDEEEKEEEEFLSINPLALTESDVKAAVKQARELQANTQRMVAIINSLLRNDVKTTMKMMLHTKLLTQTMIYLVYGPV